MAKLPFLILLASLTVGRPLYCDTGSTIRFSWAFLVRGSDGSPKAIDYSRNPIGLESGDRIRIWLKPRSECFFYLYLSDAQENLFLLFPDRLPFWKIMLVVRISTSMGTAE